MRLPCALLLTFILSSASWGQNDKRSKPSYNQDIRPLLSDRCFQCHGPDDKERKAGLHLDTFAGATADHDGVRAIVPGNPDASELLARVSTHDPDERMPPPELNKPAFTKDEIATIRAWIEDGAEYQPHWAFLPPERPSVHMRETTHPIDHFVDRALAEAHIIPAPEADASTLLRRLHLDVTGLLPAPERVAPFVAAHAADPNAAVRELVDELLASPHYGERWGRHWLDQARYADSHGYSADHPRIMWPYRDWVIAALNADQPFDQFTIDQIAGDQLPKPTKRQRVASAFHRNTLINQEGGTDHEQFRNESAVDRVNTTGAVWLGLTLGCAQCHTHKFDPITHHDYFSMFAFFNQGTDRNNRGATVPVEEGELFKTAAEEEAAAKVRAEQQAKKQAEEDKAAWLPLSFVAKTNTEATLKQLEDGSLRLSGTTPKNAVYTLEAELDDTAPAQLAAIQLRVIPDSAFPKNGPGTADNGNFVLTDFEVQLDGKLVDIERVQADHSQPGYPISHAIDDDAHSGWAINVGKSTRKGVTMNEPHEAHFILAKAQTLSGRKLTITMRHNRNDEYAIGRFALAASAAQPTEPKAWSLPKKAGKPSVNLMVMQDLPPNRQRTTYIHLRGDFLNLDKGTGPLKPGVPAIFPNRLPEAELHNRLDLAKWLVDPQNPLTARVTVNRMWMRYFGKGIVETENDFGMQGSLPTHPELLDWLATEFVRAGWSQKHMHRLMLTSRAYRRSSRFGDITPEVLRTGDPRNLLLARQNRVRVDAEIVRDLSLSASGLFSPKLGGPSVFPPQPEGVFSFTQVRKSWPTSKGPDRYRRAMYTMFYRSAPYPTLTTFDSPDFGTTCTSRVRSNTPLQALTLANDDAMVELAAGLAQRIQDGAEKRSERIEHAYQICFSRSPSADEAAALERYLDDGASWKELARVLINTDEFITRD